ncbi:MAG: hypothetical protein H0W73_05510 [Bacteroidetes bacterium]|nr:hypothetical protein [Bacteroidota bacterium]
MKTLTIYPNTYTSFKMVFILLGSIFTATVLLFYSYLLKDLIPSSNLKREYCICFGQIIFQGTLLIIFKTNSGSILNYLYQMVIVSMAGAGLLIPVLVSAFIFFPFGPGVYYYLVYFFGVVIVMFLAHKKRVQLIKAPIWLCYSWVLYRLLVLPIILS